MDNLKFKNFDITEHKADDKGNMFITGYGAVFGNVDSYNDVIEKGAFQKTLIDRGERVAFCYQHDIWNPIGKIEEMREDDNGLWIKVKLSAAEKGIQTKVKEGILKEMSIGYRTMSSREEIRDEKTITYLTEIKLFEISLVTVAANPLAVVETMKSEERVKHIEGEFDRLIAIIRNSEIKFEIEKLKSVVLSAPVETRKPEPKVKEESLSKSEILEILNNG